MKTFTSETYRRESGRGVPLLGGADIPVRPPAGHPCPGYTPEEGASTRPPSGCVWLKVAACDALVCLDVLGAGALDNLVGQLGTGRRVIPARVVEPVPNVLLVEGGL